MDINAIKTALLNANIPIVELTNVDERLSPIFYRSLTDAEWDTYVMITDPDRGELEKSRADLKAQADVMLVRLQAIQTAVNPTNAQAVAAIRDLALYMEKLTRVIRRIV